MHSKGKKPGYVCPYLGKGMQGKLKLWAVSVRMAGALLCTRTVSVLCYVQSCACVTRCALVS